jgi:thymidylate kinase
MPSEFIVIDGLDGIGKGTIEQAIEEFEESQGKSVFDSNDFAKRTGKLAAPYDFQNHDTILTAEPAYAWIGAAIREEIIKNNGREYLSPDQIEAYSLDRLISMLRIVIPATQAGKKILQSRSLASTLAYQGLIAQEEGKNIEDIWEIILNQRGNRVQLDYSPDLLIIPTIDDIPALISRLHSRKEKVDDSIFDNLQFQAELKPIYESEELREIFEQRGTKVEYLDAGNSIEETKRQALEIYQKFLNSIT